MAFETLRKDIAFFLAYTCSFCVYFLKILKSTLCFDLPKGRAIISSSSNFVEPQNSFVDPAFWLSKLNIYSNHPSGKSLNLLSRDVKREDSLESLTQP